MTDLPPAETGVGSRGAARGEFEAFVTEQAGPLLRTAYLVVWDLALSEDLVQECFTKLARRWPKVRSMDHPEAYARRVLVNLALDGRRIARRRGALEEAPPASSGMPDTSAERELARVDGTLLLVQVLATLSPRQRAVLVLRYLNEMSEAEVADAMGCSIGTVKSTASRALARLRQLPSLRSAEESSRTRSEKGAVG